MANPLFNAMGGGVPNIAQLLQQIKANPAQMLAKRFNIPQGISNPNDIINHLVQTGQVSQDRINAAYRQAQQMGFKN